MLYSHKGANFMRFIFERLILSNECRLYHPPSFRGGPPLPLPIACNVLLYGIVVERSPIRSFAADRPLFST